MESRGRKLVTLALNKQLNEKIKQFKFNRSSSYGEKDDSHSDQDYIPHKSNTGQSSNKIKILQNICIQPSSSLIVTANQSNPLTYNSSVTTDNESSEIAGCSSRVLHFPESDENADNSNAFTVLDSDSDNDSVAGTVKVIIMEILDSCFNVINSLKYTKKGEIRKRKKFFTSLQERKKMKLEKVISIHNTKIGCQQSCKQGCNSKIDQSTRSNINKEYWAFSNQRQKDFIVACVSQSNTQRKTVSNESRRKKSLKYFLKNKSGERHQVCKTFFLTTLGYNPNNDKVVRNALPLDRSSITCKPDRRKGNKRTPVVDRGTIKNHIESFRPQISHYRREHAPKRRYLPSDISIQLMYNDFKEKFPNIHFSYYLYREVVASMKISFTKLGHEECFYCELFDQHEISSGHKRSTLNKDCENCISWNLHHEKYIASRKEYQKDVNDVNDRKITVSADLQKIIMLPRCDTFKEIIFTPRLIAFNESFIPVGSKRNNKAGAAVLWHEAIRGRKKEDIISAFYAYFLSIRDKEHVALWLDNCSAQNKNWALFCFFIYLVNSPETALKHLEIKYFETGHTFMAADSFHHSVEVSLRRKQKVYDFGDFKNAVNDAEANVKVIEMTPEMFFSWTDETSQFKLKKISPRPYLQQMVLVQFKRGQYTMDYKTSIDGDWIKLNFLNAKCQKQGIKKPVSVRTCRGITQERKTTILNKIGPIMPANRLLFWKNLPISSTEDLLDDE